MAQDFKDIMSAELGRIAQTTWEDSYCPVLVRGDKKDYTSPRFLRLPIYENGLPLKGDIAGGLVSEGIGTKVVCAEQTHLWDGLHYDLLAMVLDDISRLGLTRVQALTMVIDIGVHAGDDTLKKRLMSFVHGVADLCKSFAIPLLDGEFAEMGDRIHGGVLPMIVNASASWVAKESDLVFGTEVKAGDSIIALPEPGFRSNGFTFLRHILEETWGERWMDQEITTAAGTQNVAFLVMQPATIYYKIIRDLFTKCAEMQRGLTLSGLVHVTGGGVPGKLAKYLRRSRTSAVINKTMPCMSPLIGYFLEKGHVKIRDALQHWNMGYGFLIITPYPETVLEILRGKFLTRETAPEIVGYITAPRDCAVSMNVQSVIDF